MGTISETSLSESDRGRPTAVDTIASPGTLLHTATQDSLPEGYDKIQLYVSNVTGANHTLFIQWGGTDPSDLLPIIIPGNAFYLAIPVLLLMGAAELRAYGDAADVLNVVGYVLRAAALGEPGFQSRVL